MLGFRGFRVLGFRGFRVFGFRGFRVLGFKGFRVLGFRGFRVLGFRGVVCGVWGLNSGFRVQGSGLKARQMSMGVLEDARDQGTR